MGRRSARPGRRVSRRNFTPFRFQPHVKKGKADGSGCEVNIPISCHLHTHQKPPFFSIGPKREMKQTEWNHALISSSGAASLRSFLLAVLIAQPLMQVNDPSADGYHLVIEAPRALAISSL